MSNGYYDSITEYGERLVEEANAHAQKRETRRVLPPASFPTQKPAAPPAPLPKPKTRTPHVAPYQPPRFADLSAPELKIMLDYGFDFGNQLKESLSLLETCRHERERKGDLERKLGFTRYALDRLHRVKTLYIQLHAYANAAMGNTALPEQERKRAETFCKEACAGLVKLGDDLKREDGIDALLAAQINEAYLAR